MSEQEVKNHGGLREGAGRKPSLKNPKKLLLWIGENHIELLDEQAKIKNTNKSEIIRNLIEKYLRLK